MNFTSFFRIPGVIFSQPVLLLLFFIGLSPSLLAQEWFPLKSPEHAFQYRHEGEEFRLIDTGLVIEEQLNLTLDQNDAYGGFHLGNLGAPFQELLFDYNASPHLQWGINPYPLSRHRKRDIRYYNVKGPVVDTRYLQGYERGQIFDINAALNVHERLNYNIAFSRLNAMGPYRHQNAEFNNFYISTNYISPDGRYRVLGHFNSFVQRNDENGGIADEANFTENLQPVRELIPMNLTQANNAIRQRRFYLDQQYDLGTKKTHLDEDSIERTVFTPHIMLGSSMEYNRHSFVFSDIPSDFYSNTYFNPTNTYDSTSLERFEQRFYVAAPTKSTLRWMGGAGYEVATFQTLEIFRPMNRLFGFGKAEFDWRGFHVKSDAEINFAGDQIGNFEFNNQLGYEWAENSELTAELALSSIDPGAVKQQYTSNHFLWDNDFSPVNRQMIGGRLNIQKWLKARIRYSLFQNYAYFDTDALAAQQTEVIQLFQTDVETPWRFSELSGLQNRVSFQTTGDEFSPIRVPNWYSRTVLYTGFRLFRKTLKVQPGIEAHYFSSYYAPAWMPALGSFHIQNDRQIGNFVYINFFLNIELKKAFIFLRVENVGEPLMGYNYFISPAYPLPDLSVRLGIKWRFFN